MDCILTGEILFFMWILLIVILLFNCGCSIGLWNCILVLILDFVLLSLLINGCKKFRLNVVKLSELSMVFCFVCILVIWILFERLLLLVVFNN